MGRLPWKLRAGVYLSAVAPAFTALGRRFPLRLFEPMGDTCVCVCGGGGGGGVTGGRAISHMISCTASTGFQTFAVSYAFQGFLWYIPQSTVHEYQL